MSIALNTKKYNHKRRKSMTVLMSCCFFSCLIKGQMHFCPWWEPTHGFCPYFSTLLSFALRFSSEVARMPFDRLTNTLKIHNKLI